ncbi:MULTISPECIES: DUF4123 domain-containing protein [Burkholderia]|uniref:DUF4123 domain-containing protein n=1 Tax=Burkholderia contaminans TaxID=488447 RepID=A0A2S5DXU8_9BURK|nr:MULTISPECIES: DUF4123 domain-containing protein [Burkholderia]EKS9799446.1 DUF4123 domain-containing protein [Burkholderia cepacia]EKS9806362.1 DUF4123 domain-containing protein [Burkholderia cepacia]EKS9813836.1 DUF4123 domain-containing protein [Burkholderia cepacia]EKS9823639.1 DUF4123 domain-containing protein [Burkholderia cepacia]EKS9831307.1 DUF4123 domain-containing protein [Burkholderia cepacia]
MDEVNDTGDVVDRDDAVEPGEVVDTAPNPREPAWPAFLESLKASLAHADDDGKAMRLYVLVDTRGYQELDVQLATVRGLRYASLWIDTGLDAYTDIAPYLIAFERDALDDEHAGQHRLLRQLWLDAVDLHAVTWLWSTWTFDALDAHLRRYVQYKLPNGRSYYLFFFDNHVIERMRQVWSDEQARQFVAPFTEIRYRDRRLDEVVWRNDAPAIEGAAPAGDAPGLSEQQHARLIELGYPDKLVLKFRETMGAVVDHLSDVDLHDQVVQQLDRAAAHGIVDEIGLLCYVVTGVQVAPRFDEHPAVKSSLEAVSRGETSVDAALASIDDATWDAIRDAHERALLEARSDVA